MGRNRYDIGQRFGKVEILSIQEKLVNFMCECGNSFSVSHTRLTTHMAPQQCGDCNNCDRAGEFTEVNPTSVNQRSYTSEEQRMLDEFEANAKPS